VLVRPVATPTTRTPAPSPPRTSDGVSPTSTADSAGTPARPRAARLRRAADRYPHDPRLAALLAELHAGSEEFRQIWQTRPVHAPGHRTKTLDHPEAGALRVNCDVLLVPEDDQEVVLITADPGSPAARTLRRLAGQTA